MISLVYGMPGMGKTTWMHDYIRAHAGSHRFFVVDHAEEWGPDAAHWRGQAPALLQVFERGNTDLPEQWPEVGVFVFRGRDYRDVGQLVLDIGDTTYVDDEIDFAGGKEGWKVSPLRIIVHQGRHAENAEGLFTQVNILGACRRPQSLHTDLTDIADQVCIFRVQGSRTLQRLQNDSMIEDDEWDRIRSLEKWNFRHWPSGLYLQVKPLPEDGRSAPSQEEDEVNEKETEPQRQKSNLVAIR